MIKIVCVGKVKERYFREAIEEYQKRLQKFTKLEVIEVEDMKGDNPEVIMRKERDLLMHYLHEKDFVITMEIEGVTLSSIELSQKLDQILTRNSNMVFVIGGSYGLHEDIKKRRNFSLSFSRLTFPHQLFRVLLLEQIYRSYKILNNESYHK